jgi:hypothetical protein
MLSFKESDKAIAFIKDGEHKGKILYFHEEKNDDDRLDVKKSCYLSHKDYYDGKNSYSEDNIQKIIDAIDEGYEISKSDEKLLKLFQKNLSLAENRNIKDLVLSTGSFQVIPSEEDSQRECILATGPSGSGKSHWTGEYIKYYHKMNPKNLVYIFSKKIEDPAYDGFPFVKRVILDEDFVDTPVDTKDLADSLCIFDDIESIKEKKIKDTVYKLKDNITLTGRSDNIYVVICSHIAMNYKLTRDDLNESTAIVIFKNSSRHHSKILLEKYCGLDKYQIHKILNLSSRWMFINKNIPRYCISDHEAFLL